MEIRQTAEELFRIFRRKSSHQQKAIDLLRQYKDLGNQVEVLVDIKQNHKSLLQRACILGWIDVWFLLIEEYECDPRFHVDNNGDTVLHTACLCGHVDLVRYLVSKPWSMDPLMKNVNGVTPLDYSNKFSHVRKYLETILDDMPEYMSKPESSQSISLFSEKHLFGCFRRKTSDQMEAVKLIRGYKSEANPLKDLVDTKEHHYKCLLQWAGIRGWTDVCKILIDDHRCDPFYKDDNKWTVLHNVCRNGYIDLVRYFVSKPFEMDPLEMNKKGFTPLEFSRIHGYTEITKYLESIIVPPLNRRSLLTKRNHSAISEDESVCTGTTARKPHDHDEEDDDNMETGMINKTSETARKQRKRKSGVSVDTRAIKKSFNDNSGDGIEDNVSKSSGSTKNIHEIPELVEAFAVLKGKSAQWNGIGRELDLVSGNKTFNDREGLRDQLCFNEDRLEAVLNKWLEQGGVSSTWGQLIEVLKGLGFNDVLMSINTADVA